MEAACGVFAGGGTAGIAVSGVEFSTADVNAVTKFELQLAVIR